LIVGVGLALLTRPSVSPTNADRRRDLNFPDENPQKRAVYGATKGVGTPIPWPVVGEFAYTSYLISSRPSVGPFTVYIENTELSLTGDPYDFTGPGATPTEGVYQDHVNVWIGRGDQTGPPDAYVAEAPYHVDDEPLGWRASDKATDCTVLYIKMRAGRHAPEPGRAIRTNGLGPAKLGDGG